MGKITFDYSKTAGFISEEEIGYMSRLTKQAKDVFVSKNGAGNNFLGRIDLPESTCRDLDIVIASIHPPCYGMGHTEEENMRAYEAVMKKPYINIIGHPDDGRFQIDYERLVKMAKETGTLLEVNNSSMRPSSSRKGTRENILTMLDLCKQYDVPVTTGSDAHVDVDAGNFTYVKEVLKFCDFPEELVVTTKFDVLKQYLNMNTFGM